LVGGVSLIGPDAGVLQSKKEKTKLPRSQFNRFPTATRAAINGIDRESAEDFVATKDEHYVDKDQRSCNAEDGWARRRGEVCRKKGD